jgi:hypothetical protein
MPNILDLLETADLDERAHAVATVETLRIMLLAAVDFAKLKERENDCLRGLGAEIEGGVDAVMHDAALDAILEAAKAPRRAA